jgi:hypothetical protein
MGGRRVTAIAALAAAMWLGVASASADTVGRDVYRGGQIGDDIYAAGVHVVIDADVTGDVAAAAAIVRVGRRVSGDVAAGGGVITVSGEVGDDVRVAGGQIEIEAAIGDDLFAAGGSVELLPTTRIGGSATVVALARVAVAGDIAGGLTVAAVNIDLASRIGGSVKASGRRIRLFPGTVILGDFTYFSAEPAEIAQGVVIRGKTVHRIARSPIESESIRTVAGAVWYGLGLAWVAGLALVGAMVLLVFPAALTAATGAIQNAFGPSLGFGALAIFATPPAILFLFVTIVGIPLAMFAGAAFAAALFLAYLTAAFWLGDRCLWLIGRSGSHHRGLRFLGLIAALIVFKLVGAIPFVGWLALLAAVMAGLGAWIHAATQRRAPASV